MGTEKNDASVAPIPAPPVTPAVPGPPAPAGAGVVFTPVSAQGKKRMKLIGILVGVLVVLVIAGVVAIKVANSSRTPEAEVRKYLDLLAAGKASAATAMVDPGVPNNQRTFLTDDAMASATSLLVVEDVVADKNDDSDTRTVTATLSVDGQHFTRTFTVVADDPAMGVFNTWTIKESLATAVSVSGVKIDQFSVGGVSTSIESSSATLDKDTYVFYPGIYTLTPIAPNEYVDAYPVTIYVRDNVRTTSVNEGVTFLGLYTDKLTDEVHKAIRERVGSCVSASSYASSQCPSALNNATTSSVDIKELPAELTQSRGGSTTLEGDVVLEYDSAKGRKEARTTAVVTMRTDERRMLALTPDGKPDFTLTFRY